MYIAKLMLHLIHCCCGNINFNFVLLILSKNYIEYFNANNTKFCVEVCTHKNASINVINSR